MDQPLRLFMNQPLCDLCRFENAVVYCKPDSANLCLNCDSRVHSANALSCRHARSFLCEKCNSQPAIARYMFDEMLVCESCACHDPDGCLRLCHKCEALSSYTGPSLAESSNIWSLVLDISSSSDGFGVTKFDTFLPKNYDNFCSSKCLDQPDDDVDVDHATSGLVTVKCVVP